MTNGTKSVPTIGSEVEVFERSDGEVRVDLYLEKETVWLSQRVMATVFGTTIANVFMHLRSVFSDGELGPEATTKDSLVVQIVGLRPVRRGKHDDLDEVSPAGRIFEFLERVDRENTAETLQVHPWKSSQATGPLLNGISRCPHRFLGQTSELHPRALAASQLGMRPCPSMPQHSSIRYWETAKTMLGPARQSFARTVTQIDARLSPRLSRCAGPNSAEDTTTAASGKESLPVQVGDRWQSHPQQGVANIPALWRSHLSRVLAVVRLFARNPKMKRSSSAFRRGFSGADYPCPAGVQSRQ